MFFEFVEEEDLKFISASQVEEFLKDEAQVFVMFVALKVESKAAMLDLAIMCEFSFEFLDDIIVLPLERD